MDNNIIIIAALIIGIAMLSASGRIEQAIERGIEVRFTCPPGYHQVITKPNTIYCDPVEETKHD